MKKYLQIAFGIGIITILVVGLISCGSEQNSPVAPEGGAMDFLNYETTRNNSAICPSNDKYGVWVGDYAFVVAFKTAGQYAVRVTQQSGKMWTWENPPGSAVGTSWGAMMHHIGVFMSKGVITKVEVKKLPNGSWMTLANPGYPLRYSCSITSNRAHPSTWVPPRP